MCIIFVYSSCCVLLYTMFSLLLTPADKFSLYFNYVRCFNLFYCPGEILCKYIPLKSIIVVVFFASYYAPSSQSGRSGENRFYIT